MSLIAHDYVISNYVFTYPGSQDHTNSQGGSRVCAPARARAIGDDMLLSNILYVYSYYVTIEFIGFFGNITTFLCHVIH